MSSPNSTFTEIVTTTYRKHKKELADNVSNHNALLRKLTAKGRKRTEDGGQTIVTPLDYAENSTYGRYSGYDALDVSASDVLSAAEYEWKQAAVHITASGREIRQNMGSDTRILNLVQERINNAMRTAKNNMSNDVYSDGTAANQINGLQAVCPATAGGTLGGINGSTFSFWQHVVQSAAAPISGSAITVSATTFEQFVRQLYIELTRGMDKPDMLVLSNDYYEFFEGSQVSNKRYTTDTNTSQDSANAGLVNLKYKTCDVFHDGGSGIPSASGFMLNTDFIELVEHKDAQWTEVDEQRAVNQDAVVIPVLWMGNICVNNRSLQGRLGA